MFTNRKSEYHDGRLYAPCSRLLSVARCFRADREHCSRFVKAQGAVADSLAAQLVLLRRLNAFIRRGSMRRHRCSLVLATAVACGLATMARAEVRVEGSLAAVRVTTDQDAIADVLSAIAATFNVKYRTAIPLSAPANTTYAGPFGQVVSRLLDGYNYVIKKDQGTTEIVVLGRRGEAAVQPAAPQPTPSNGIIERWPAAPKGTPSRAITEPWH
jgi:hypothetical protein